MKRREFLKGTAVLATQVMAGQMVVDSLTARRAQAATGYPVRDLISRIAPTEATFLVPTDAKFGEMLTSFNLRTQLKPQLRALCKTPAAVARTLRWARDNQVPLAIRGGGHSYEGFSQSEGVVIDTRLMNGIEIDASGENASFGSGLALGQVYAALAEKGRAIPAGSCPTVGIAGHTTGGGFGLLARPFGLACDNLVSLEMVDADGRVLTASAQENQDLFWACRGGGNGQFGVITRLNFKTHALDHVAIFAMGWTLPPERALRVAKAWQAFVSQAPESMTFIFKFSKNPDNGLINLRFVGQSIGSEDEIRRAVQPVASVEIPTSKLKIETRPFMGAVKYFAGGFEYESIYMKGKSDYLVEPMSDQGFLTLMRELQKLPAGAVVAIFDSYGGAVNRVAPDATAFAHRQNTLCSIQYYSQWGKAKDSESRLQKSRNLYQAMRPFVSGRAYVNYCDLDLNNWAQAYWGDNLPRLQQVKKAYDPTNFFRHAQSIPLPD